MKSADRSMTVEIWSDIMCPFCYLGKHKFESALSQFPENEHVRVLWRSFQLNPDLKTGTYNTINDYLSRTKGFPVDHAQQLNDQLTRTARDAGLEFNVDRAVVANTLKAHNLLHASVEQGLQNEIKERLLKAYFTEGKNVDDIPTLVDIAEQAGMKTNGLADILEREAYTDEVQDDISEARELGVRGVPFFVFDRKYAVSGAQDVSVFLQTLEKSFTQWRESHPKIKLTVSEGDSCRVDGECS